MILEFRPLYVLFEGSAAWTPLYPRQARKGLVEFCMANSRLKTGMDAGF
jgi:hypothetical protein